MEDEKKPTNVLEEKEVPKKDLNTADVGSPETSEENETTKHTTVH